MQPWPTRIRATMIAAQNKPNREAQALERAGRAAEGVTLRLFGRLNGIEDALVALSQQIAEQDASRR